MSTPYSIRTIVCLIALLLGQLLSAQDPKASLHLAPEILTGISNDSNTDFPARRLQQGAGLYIGWDWAQSTEEWAQRLQAPRTGFMLSFLDFGNRALIGHSYALMPFIELPISGDDKAEWTVNAAFGAAYIDRSFDPLSNPLNQGISTLWNWSYKAGIQRSIHSGRHDYRLGLGYMHQSNGHTRLPNQGINSFQVMLSMRLNTPKAPPTSVAKEGWEDTSGPKTFFMMRTGLGLNAFSRMDNDQRPVKTLALSVGRRMNRAWSYDMGIFLRHYSHYQDYIEGTDNAVDTLYPFFRDNPFGYASAIGFQGHGELYLGRVGIELGLGLNLYKPAYKLDWQINEANPKDGEFAYGELDWYYEVKRTVSSRMGLKLYAWPVEMDRRFNLFLGGHINANLGQADFSEVSLGLVLY